MTIRNMGFEKSDLHTLLNTDQRCVHQPATAVVLIPSAGRKALKGLHYSEEQGGEGIKAEGYRNQTASKIQLLPKVCLSSVTPCVPLLCPRVSQASLRRSTPPSLAKPPPGSTLLLSTRRWRCRQPGTQHSTHE